MRIWTVLVALLLGAGMAHAQVISPLGGSNNRRPGTPLPGASAPAPEVAPPSSAKPSSSASPHRARRTLAQRFEAANTTHDGKLTLEQARAGRLNAVARDFDKIDKDKDGTVTMDEIKAYQAEQRAARRSARAPAPTQ